MRTRAKAGAPPLLEIRDATVYRGGTRVFERFSLTIGQGEQVAILGPNGAGKTTLLKLINRELYPVAGRAATLRILGRSQWNVWQLRSRLGIVSHDLQAGYRGSTTALDVVLSGFLSSIGVHGALEGRITASQRELARVTLRELGFEALAGAAYAAMSTGQQRRCLLARALVHDPDTLVLDEPTAGLDLAATFDYLGRISALVGRGKSIVLVTHMLHEIPPEVERVILLREGRVVADGPKRSVLTSDNLERAYGTALQLTRVDDYYFASPPRSE